MWVDGKAIKDLKDECKRLQELNNLNVEIMNKHEISIRDLRRELNNLNVDYVSYREEVNNRFKKLNTLINEKLDFQKEENEAQLIGLQKVFNQKISNLTEGKPLIQDLLKKIAHLEGVKESSERRRPTLDIMNKLSEYNDLMLETEREEKDTSSIKEQVNILKWVLGEI